MKVLFTGMEWFPSCQVGGLDRYFYEQLEALSETGKVSGTAVVTSCAPQDNGPVKLRAMAQQGASILQRWQGARAEARRAFSEGAELVNAHFALYAFAYVSELSPSVPLVINFQGPWAEEMRVQAKTLRRRMVARLCKLIELRVYRKATRVITLSNAFRDLIHRDYGVPLKMGLRNPGRA